MNSGQTEDEFGTRLALLSKSYRKSSASQSACMRHIKTESLEIPSSYAQCAWKWRLKFVQNLRGATLATHHDLYKGSSTVGWSQVQGSPVPRDVRRTQAISSWVKARGLFQFCSLQLQLNIWRTTCKHPCHNFFVTATCVAFCWKVCQRCKVPRQSKAWSVARECAAL